MRRLQYIAIVVVAMLGFTSVASAQTYVKLNGAYALCGMVNPQVEFKISDHSTFQTEIVYSPWQSIKGHPMHFGIFQNEYRYYIKVHNRGFYVAANIALKAFKMSKPELHDWRVTLQNRYCKGHGYMLGAAIGYEYQFAKRWLLDIFVGFGYSQCWYNGYSLDHVIDMSPSRPAWKEPPSPDPYNISAQWLPTKVGISIGFLINRPK